MIARNDRMDVVIPRDDAANFRRALMRLIEISGEGWIPDRADLIVLESLAAALAEPGHTNCALHKLTAEKDNTIADLRKICEGHEKTIAALGKDSLTLSVAKASVVIAERDARIAELQQRLRQASLTAHSVTFGEIPANLREAEIWEPHEWDNFTVWQQRDAALRVASQAVTQRDAEIDNLQLARVALQKEVGAAFIRGTESHFVDQESELSEVKAELKEWQGYWGSESPHDSHVLIGNSNPLDRALSKEQERANTAVNQLAEAQRKLETVREALEELSMLGGGGLPGNSDGNRIAQRALSVISSNKI